MQGRPRSSRPFRLLSGILLLAGLLGCSQLEEEGSAIRRGDEAFARGQIDEALAEYRLALKQGADDARAYARVAHAFAAEGRVDEVREYYRLAAERDPSLADQAVADLVRLAREAAARGDEFGMSSAVQAALEFRPGISLPDLALPLARHFSARGDYGRALPFYQRALAAVGTDSLPELLFETAIAYDEIGDCEHAVVHYEEYRSRLPRWRRGEVDWRLGNCSYRLARRYREEGRDEDALQYLETLLRVGEPRNLLALGYFEKGEILALRGECEAAVEAYARVPGVDPAGNSPLVTRSQRRIDEIRFGRLRRALEWRRGGEEPVPCIPVEGGRSDTVGGGGAP